MGKRTKAAKPPASSQAPGSPPLVQGSLADWGKFSDGLVGIANPFQLDKALLMLRSERFRLFADVQPDHVTGVVRSQSTSTRVYSCRLARDGSYACCTQNLITCVISRGSPCKHLLVLVLGLVNAGELDRETALAWLKAAHDPAAKSVANTTDRDLMAATFLKYKGMEAGEVDWRPTETIPEDFYFYSL